MPTECQTILVPRLFFERIVREPVCSIANMPIVSHFARPNTIDKHKQTANQVRSYCQSCCIYSPNVTCVSCVPAIKPDRSGYALEDDARGSSEAVRYDVRMHGIHFCRCSDMSTTLGCLVWVDGRVIHLACRTNGGVCVTVPDRT